MTQVEGEIVRKKLAVMGENLKALDPIAAMTEEEYIDDLYKRKATERLLQELIEASIDINTHLIAHSGNIVPDDYYTTFIKAGELKILPKELANKLAPSAGLRNRLVHEYDALQHSFVLEAVKMAIDLYPAYMRAIEDYISRKD